MNVEEKREERIEFATELICEGLPRLEIQKQIRKKYSCNHNTARNTVTQALGKLGEDGEKFNEVDSKIGFIENKYHEMLAEAEKIESQTSRIDKKMTILRALGDLIGANHHVKERIVIGINNNMPSTNHLAPNAISGALKRVENKNDDTIVEISPDAANVLTEDISG